MTKQEFIKLVEGKALNSLTHIVTITQLPTGAREVAINTERLEEKVNYILDTYNDNMEHRYAKVQEGQLPVKILSVALA